MAGPMEPDPASPASPTAPTDEPAPGARRDRGGRAWIDRAPGGPWRSRDDRVFTGLAGGIGEWLAVPSTAVRAGLAFLLVGSGFGIMAYVAVAVVLPVADRATPSAERGVRIPRGRALERSVLALCIAFGVAMFLRIVGVWVGSDLGLPSAVAAAGLSLVWSRTDAERRELWRSRLLRLPGDAPVDPARVAGGRRRTVARLVAGAVLSVVGAFWVLAVARPETVGPVVLAVTATVGGLALLGGPWVAGLWRDLRDERRERIRSEERAEVAARIHDSVLQTLALIQRDPETPRRVANLARHQERSLRRWLFDDEPDASDGARAGWAGPRRPGERGDLPAPPTFAARLRQVTDEVEDTTGAAVELVVVGDVPADERTDALVAATREAVLNSAVHGGTDDVAVFAEAGPGGVTVYVRDRGRGFVPDSVPADRRGLRESVVGRLARIGGRATVVSAPGEGTEICLELVR